jgi:hypothetical protein
MRVTGFPRYAGHLLICDRHHPLTARVLQDQAEIMPAIGSSLRHERRDPRRSDCSLRLARELPLGTFKS